MSKKKRNRQKSAMSGKRQIRIYPKKRVKKPIYKRRNIGKEKKFCLTILWFPRKITSMENKYFKNKLSTALKSYSVYINTRISMTTKLNYRFYFIIDKFNKVINSFHLMFLLDLIIILYIPEISLYILIAKYVFQCWYKYRIKAKL